MKKVLVIVCVAAFMLSIATVAMASETDWMVQMRASTGTYTNASGAIGFATKAGGNDGWGDDVSWTNSASTGAGLAVYNTDVPTSPTFCAIDRRAPLTGTDSKEWELRMWLNESYGGGNLVLAFYNISSQDLPVSIAGVDYLYYLEMINDPTGTFTAGTKWTIDAAAANTTSTSPLGVIAFSDWEGLKMAPSAAVAGGVQMRFVAQTTWQEPVIPEPGSMLALASGLVGMAGYAIRRRRA